MRVLKLLRIAKLRMILFKVRASRFDSFQFEEFFMNDFVNQLLDFGKLLVIIFFIIHWVGCFFFAIGYAEWENGDESWITLAGLQLTDDYGS
jgi:hypothetical protein